jgi:hypothetical protein
MRVSGAHFAGVIGVLHMWRAIGIERFQTVLKIEIGLLVRTTPNSGRLFLEFCR